VKRVNGPLTIDTIAAMLAEELRRLPCRVDHAKEPCKKCEALALYAAHVSIVQTPKVAAQAALRAVADQPGERHD
jgi:hypothetical protein